MLLFFSLSLQLIEQKNVHRIIETIILFLLIFTPSSDLVEQHSMTIISHISRPFSSIISRKTGLNILKFLRVE